MDYKKLAADLLSVCEKNCADCDYVGDSKFECTIEQLAATAITDLLSRAEAAEARVNEMETTHYTGADALRRDMVPLTMEQLHEMRGKWVWVVSPDKDLTVSGWAYVGANRVFTYWEYKPDELVGRVVYNLSDYGAWLAYACQPIDGEGGASSTDGAEMGCETCAHKKICDLWRSAESQDASCFIEDCFEEKAEARCQTLEKMVREYQETIIPGYRERAEAAEAAAKAAAQKREIDWDAWKGCTCNSVPKACCTCVSFRCQYCMDASEYKRGDYCSSCGRPLNAMARLKLEMRLKGE